MSPTPSLHPGAQGTVALDPLTGKAKSPPFVLSVPSQAAGASKVFFDLWNGSTVPLVLGKLVGIKDGSVAVTGVVAVKLIATRTSAIGTGGTAAVAESATVTDSVISATDPSVALPSGVTARSAPSGGATAGAVLGEAEIFPEETSDQYLPVDLVPADTIIPAGTGIRVIQGAVASVGNIGFRADIAIG